MAIEIEMKNVSACKRAGGRWNLKKEICLFTSIDTPTRKALNRDTKDTLSEYLYEIFEEYTKREVLDYFDESFRYFEEYTKREVIDYCIGDATKKRLVNYTIDVMDEDRKVGIVQDYFE